MDWAAWALQVRVRCIGADGAGHGEWSLPGQVSLPDHLLPAAPEASISTAVVRASSPAAEQSGSASGHARGRRRTGRGGAAMASIADAATRQGRGRPGEPCIHLSLQAAMHIHMCSSRCCQR